MVGKSEGISGCTEKMKDAEPLDDINLRMVTVAATISETSVVLERTDEPAPKKKAAGWRTIRRLTMRSKRCKTCLSIRV